MRIMIENGYVSSYAFEGNIVGSIEVPDPPDQEHFKAHYSAYRVKDGVLAYDEKQNKEIERKALSRPTATPDGSTAPAPATSRPGLRRNGHERRTAA